MNSRSLKMMLLLAFYLKKRFCHGVANKAYLELALTINLKQRHQKTSWVPIEPPFDCCYWECFDKNNLTKNEKH